MSTTYTPEMHATRTKAHETADHTALKVGDKCNLFYLGAPISGGENVRVSKIGRKWVSFNNGSKVLVKHDADACWFTAIATK